MEYIKLSIDANGSPGSSSRALSCCEILGFLQSLIGKILGIFRVAERSAPLHSLGIAARARSRTAPGPIERPQPTTLQAMIPTQSC